MIARESNWTCPRRIIAVSLLAASALTALANSAFSDIRKIAFTSIRDGKPAIHIMNSDGTNPVNLTSGRHPTWSPDGEKIAFAFGLGRFRDDVSDIFVMDADGKNRVNLTEGENRVNSAPDWSPDGERIAFASNRGRQTHIFVMDADGTNMVNLTQDLNIAHSPDWSPDGEKIVFGTEGDIFVMDARGANRINLTQNPRRRKSHAELVTGREKDCLFGIAQTRSLVCAVQYLPDERGRDSPRNAYRR